MCTIMLVTIILFATLGTTFAGYAGSSSNDVGGSNSYGYGYSGSFSGTGDNIPAVPIPNFPNFDFSSLFNGRRPFAFAITSSSPNANVQAQSSITFVNNNRLQQQLAEQQAQLASQAGTGYAPGFSSYDAPSVAAGGGGGGGGQIYSGGTGSGGAYSGSIGGAYPGGVASRGGFAGSGGVPVADGGAVASASIGPKGGYQTAAVYPENPNVPNIFSRFAETAGTGGKGGGTGSYGVFTSSVSSSSNVDGKPQSFHQASTTINDNGKVSTYTVKNP